ncbi:hypothetical protein OBBRIDRAFT_23929 [Obba rivulosa]|uniref:Uncharacterized protein n=1 Tax=Obba rivulosa TaxID=1052685 RepID=A0A8E2J5G2_9APHY|nr:hypothetical protein OBBRIDRAFT_23929 [Obba rivulosa]
MADRQRTAGGPSATEEYKAWAHNESDSDQPRQTMGAALRHGVEPSSGGEGHKKRKSSRRVDPSNATNFAVPGPSHHSHSVKDRSRTTQSLASYPGAPQTHIHAVTTTPVATSSSRTRPPDMLYGSTDLRTSSRKQAEVASSYERLPTAEEARYMRATGQPSAYVTTTSVQIVPPSSHADHSSSRATRDPSSASRQHRERDKEREKERHGGHRDKERDRDRVRKGSEYARAVEEVLERERRHREKERPGKDRHRSKDWDKPSATGGWTGIPRDTPQVSNAVPAQRPQFTDYNKPPASSSNWHDPPVQQPVSTSIQQTGPSTLLAGNASSANVTRPTAPIRSQKDEPIAPRSAPPLTSERERATSSRHHRSHRDKLLAQQSGQDSGMSSSEQEHSGRERPRTSERRQGMRTHLADSNNPSGPSGSENERQSVKERLLSPSLVQHRMKLL